MNGLKHEIATVTNAVKDLRSNLIQKFVADVQNGYLVFGEAVKNWQRSPKNTSQALLQFYSSIHQNWRERTIPKIAIHAENAGLALFESPDYPNAQNIKSCLNEALVNKSSTTFDFFARGFTIVTDVEAVMAKIAGASVSKEIHVPDEAWMSCMAISWIIWWKTLSPTIFEPRLCKSYCLTFVRWKNHLVCL